MKLDGYSTRFIQNSQELMQQIRYALSDLQESPGDATVVSAIPCATQEIKKLSNFHGCKHVVAFSCVFEDVLSTVRSGELRADVEIIALLMSSCDLISEMVSQIDTLVADAVSAKFVGLLVKSLELIGQLRLLHGYQQDTLMLWAPETTTGWSNKTDLTSQSRLN